MSDSQILTPYSIPAPDLKFYDTSYGSNFGYNERGSKFNKHHGCVFTPRGDDFFSMEAHSTLNTYPIFRRDWLGFRREFPPQKRMPIPPYGQNYPPQIAPPQPPDAAQTVRAYYPCPPRVPSLRLPADCGHDGSSTSRDPQPPRIVRNIKHYTPRTFTPRVFTGRYAQ